MTWDPAQYDRFAAEREQSFWDLAALVQPTASPPNVVDLGCGDGRLTAALHARLGARSTLGIDSSPSMLAGAPTDVEGVTFTHRWAGAIDTCTRFCAFFGTARGGDVAYAVGFTGLGVGATRFGANVMLDLLDGEDTERTRLRMVRERPLPFPPEPLATAGIAAVRWSLDQADHRQGKRNILLKTLDALKLGFDS